ncbi:DedA family protein [Patulibacter defluvii]|uniref:DedA family protein n=1 Tax=Patulibacter defluvii TaxID=3095358 RepID=UPI002A74A466|nr:DedA family protein [Patulibacter sp. DM4]
MIDDLLDLAEGAVSSPWFFVAIFAFAAIDGFLPAVPSESLVITAGVFAAAGEPSIVPVIAAAAGGAFVGDHLSYLIGRKAGGPLQRRLREGTRRHAAFLWARDTLVQRGGTILIVARYIPGGRTAVTLTAGAVAYPRRTFTPFVAVAALSWGVYSAMIGYLGGHAFEDQPLKGLALGFGLSLLLAGAIELARHRAARRRRTTATPPAPASRRPRRRRRSPPAPDRSGSTAATAPARRPR